MSELRSARGRAYLRAALRAGKDDTLSGLRQIQNELGYGGWGEGVDEASLWGVDVFGLRGDDASLVEGVVGVNVGVREHGGGGGFDLRAVDDELGFSRFADGRIHDGQDESFVVERGGTVEGPKRCGLAVAIVVNVWRAEHRAN